MKQLFRIVIALVLAGVITAVLTGMSMRTSHWGKVLFVPQASGPDRVLLFAPKLSPGDRAAFDKILSTNKKSLYKVVSLKKGKVEHIRGTLNDVSVGQVVYQQLLKEAEEQQTTDQAWLCDSPSGTNMVSKEQFIEDLEKILAKYTEKKS